MKLEIAKDRNDAVIGWRLTVGEQCFLIWKDQAGMPGIRVGDEFIPPQNNWVWYEDIYQHPDSAGDGR